MSNNIATDSERTHTGTATVDNRKRLSRMSILPKPTSYRDIDIRLKKVGPNDWEATISGPEDMLKILDPCIWRTTTDYPSKEWLLKRVHEAIDLAWENRISDSARRD